MKKSLLVLLLIVTILSLTSCFETEPKYSEGLAYELINEETYKVVGIGSCKDENIVIPATYEGIAVTEIGDSAFRGNNYLYSVEIPEGVTKIGSAAFKDCSFLASVTFPTTLEIIESGAFSYCSKLSEVNLPKKLIKIGSLAFESIGSIEKVVIPRTVTEIGSNAFKNNYLLTIYCEIESQPSGWNRYWNEGNTPVIWGYSE